MSPCSARGMLLNSQLFHSKNDAQTQETYGLGTALMGMKFYSALKIFSWFFSLKFQELAFSGHSLIIFKKLFALGVVVKSRVVLRFIICRC